MPVTGDRTVEQTELLIDTGWQITELVGDAYNPALSDEDAPPVIRERVREIFNLLGVLWDTAYEAGKAAGG